MTNDTTAEIFSPPYLNLGPRPVITSFPDSMLPGDDLNITYTSADPVTKAILIRTGVATHSMAFGAPAQPQQAHSTRLVAGAGRGGAACHGLPAWFGLTGCRVPATLAQMHVRSGSTSSPT